MEFLLTYGWAVLIMLAVISILFYIGVFSPETIAPRACALPGGFNCYAFKIQGSGSLTLDVVQSTGHTIYIYAIGCSDEDEPSSNTTVNQRLYNGERMRLNATCYKSDGTTPSVNDYYKGTLYLRYLDEDTDITHNIIGEISAKVEEST